MLETITFSLSMWGMTFVASIGLILGLDRSGRRALRMWLIGLILNSLSWLIIIIASLKFERTLASVSIALMAASMSAVHCSAKRFLNGSRPGAMWWYFPPALGLLVWIGYDQPMIRSILTDGVVAVQIAIICASIAFSGGAPGRWRVTALIALMIPIPFMIGRVFLQTSRLGWFDPDALNLVLSRTGFLAESACIVLLSMAFLLAYGQEAQAKLEKLANLDGLSGLLNRRAWSEAVMKTVMKSKNGLRTSIVLILDLDHFKSINDTYGHGVGDQVIRCLGDTARETLRTGDIVGRYGGEEFCIFFPELTEAELHVVDRRLRAHFLKGAMRAANIAVTFSSGATTVNDGEDLQAALNRADLALYKSKQAGRNQLTYASSNRQ